MKFSCTAPCIVLAWGHLGRQGSQLRSHCPLVPIVFSQMFGSLHVCVCGNRLFILERRHCHSRGTEGVQGSSVQ